MNEVEELPRAKVYDFLLKNHRPLSLPYLEHIVYEWHDSNALFHNALALHYMEKIIRLTKKLSEKSDPNLQSECQEIKKKLRSFLELSKHCSPEAVLVKFPHDCKYSSLFNSNFDYWIVIQNDSVTR